MYSNLEKLVLAVVAVAMITLILFTNSTKDVELSSTSPLETESVISQEVAVVSDEVVEDVTLEDNPLNEETWLESEMYVKTTDMDSLKEVNKALNVLMRKGVKKKNMFKDVFKMCYGSLECFRCFLFAIF